MKLKYTWILFVLSLLVIIPLRLYQISMTSGQIFSIDVNDNLLIGIFIYIMLFFSLIIICMSLLSQPSQNSIPINKNIFISIILLLLGICIIFQSVEYLTYNTPSRSENEKIQLLVMSAFSLVTGVVFVIMSTCYAFKNNRFKKIPLFMLFPTVWLTIRLVFSFVSNTAVSSKNVEMMVVVANGFLVLFFVYNSKIYLFSEDKNIFKMLHAFGMPAIIFSLSYELPTIYELVFNWENSTRTIEVSLVINILMSIYIISILIVNRQTGTSKIIRGRHFAKNLKKIKKDMDMNSNFINYKTEESMLGNK